MANIMLAADTATTFYGVAAFRTVPSTSFVVDAHSLPTEITWATAPDTSRATLRRRLLYDATAGMMIERVNRTNHYVRIYDQESATHTTNRTWHGIVTQSNLQQARPDFITGGGSKPAPKCCTPWDWNTSCKAHYHDQRIQLSQRAKAMSARADVQFQGTKNRTTQQTPAPMFEGLHQDNTLLSGSAHWSTRDIVAYLIYFESPTTRTGQAPVTFAISAAELNKLPNDDQPEVTTHGRSMWDILNQVMPPYRLITWWLEYDETTSVVNVKLARLNLSPIVMPTSGHTLPGNSNIKNLNIAGSPSSQVIERESSADQYQQFVFQSARERIGCLIWACRDGTLTEKWTSTQFNDYQTGASGFVGWPAASEIAERQRMDREFRALPQVKDVFAKFGLPEDWDQKAADGIGNTKYPLAETKDIFGQTVQYTIYPAELVFFLTCRCLIIANIMVSHYRNLAC
ncbi:MAG: hypothetical protein HC889_20495 [Synechococcaceae cyanobacterium SM1_2_3]|nr:hypothetical protein [Synechococcaceae cyanobacterium SM1_2_3]